MRLSPPVTKDLLVFRESPSVAYLVSADRPRTLTHLPYRIHKGPAEAVIAKMDFAIEPFAKFCILLLHNKTF